MNGGSLISAVRKKLSEGDGRRITDGAIAKFLGISIPGLNVWKKRGNITDRQMVSLLSKARSAGANAAEGSAISPIVEFFEITTTKSRGGARMEILNSRGGHPYLRGLRSELEKHRGVYIFYDSSGSALYVGKTARLTLWKEINNAFNRERSVQKIRRVKHPQRKQAFATSEEKSRQIRPRSVPLLELARYVSAYRVSDGLIDNLEALLIRGFANDIQNTKMENFS